MGLTVALRRLVHTKVVRASPRIRVHPPTPRSGRRCNARGCLPASSCRAAFGLVFSASGLLLPVWPCPSIGNAKAVQYSWLPCAGSSCSARLLALTGSQPSGRPITLVLQEVPRHVLYVWEHEQRVLELLLHLCPSHGFFLLVRREQDRQKKHQKQNVVGQGAATSGFDGLPTPSFGFPMSMIPMRTLPCSSIVSV